MIVEHAEFSIAEADAEKFEAAYAQARELLAQTDGFLWAHMHRGIERPDSYLLLVGWESLEAHTVDFRESERFPQWRALIGPYFAAAPTVEHYREV
ncbi:MAG TPA: antibiotic biosynthesis monooxygenase family protein [Actinospica sp.]|nr:antibiotic biosynthesis monooxygenase family protein [Actinospica sp.]